MTRDPAWSNRVSNQDSPLDLHASLPTWLSHSVVTSFSPAGNPQQDLYAAAVCQGSRARHRCQAAVIGGTYLSAGDLAWAAVGSRHSGSHTARQYGVSSRVQPSACPHQVIRNPAATGASIWQVRWIARITAGRDHPGNTRQQPHHAADASGLTACAAGVSRSSHPALLIIVLAAVFRAAPSPPVILLRPLTSDNTLHHDEPALPEQYPPRLVSARLT